ncbi:iron-containing alcohol dehydrogenase [Jiangella anatolica]|uniref:Iron-containing alcohol dehydrogenase n=1 Tax=Jiangella anatolica TaxID=2670374 RepID=A0A2W2C1S6_9ACTN|nr:iron-containing alcohol dehydrogenase [Jiangella anatolica]PZF81927.1 hypothetical protein C1I92_19065 [Jiangella anatolica]
MTIDFTTVFGRGLLPEIGKIANAPFAVVSMPDLASVHRGRLGAEPALVLDAGLDRGHLEELVGRCASMRTIVGIGGGQALDAAKYLAWRLRLPLFQVPTALSVNAAWGHRSAVRTDGIVQYVGWAVPEAVFVDFDLIRAAPPVLNWSGAADVLCYHTALWDWRFAAGTGKVEAAWPYDERLAAASDEALRRVVDHVDEIHALTDDGIRSLVASLAYGGGAFAAAGWNPRHIEGADHFLFYALEYVTGRSFLHGQAVGLGILIASALQGNEPDRIRGVLDRLGLPYRPADMGITWDDVNAAFDRVHDVIELSGLWYTILSARPITPAFRAAIREWIDAADPAPWADPDA